MAPARGDGSRTVGLRHSGLELYREPKRLLGTDGGSGHRRHLRAPSLRRQADLVVTKFRDILYGEIEIPDCLLPFLRIPEFVRLRGVRLSNVDSYQFKDFSGPTRWEHGVAVAALALQCGLRRGLSDTERYQLALAGLLHDVATPPFGHTAEYVLPSFNHELETQNVLAGRISADSLPDVPVF